MTPTKNGFERHGIKHSSVSQINKMEDAFDAWFAEKVCGHKFPTSAAMWRGIVCEDIVVDVVSGASEFKDAIEKRLVKYDRMAGPLFDPSFDKERSNIEPIAELAIENLSKYGKPTFPIGGQQKVSITCNGDGWKLPIIGFLDLVYPDKGLVIDLKTTTRMPSKMSAQHRRQRCFYQKCMGNSAVQFLYVTPKKATFMEDGDVAEELADIKAILNRTERFLRAGDQDLLTEICPHNKNSFYWRGAESVRQEVFGN